jgi:hypothetical protein
MPRKRLDRVGDTRHGRVTRPQAAPDTGRRPVTREEPADPRRLPSTEKTTNSRDTEANDGAHHGSANAARRAPIAPVGRTDCANAQQGGVPPIVAKRQGMAACGLAGIRGLSRPAKGVSRAGRAVVLPLGAGSGPVSARLPLIECKRADPLAGEQAREARLPDARSAEAGQSRAMARRRVASRCAESTHASGIVTRRAGTAGPGRAKARPGPVPEGQTPNYSG